jgi:AcrR family transcriptional regulator
MSVFMEIQDDPMLPGLAARRPRGRPACRDLVGRDALLRIARQAFARQGYMATSVRDIARTAGVDSALLAHHFGSKDALWGAVVEQLTCEQSPMIEATRALREQAVGSPRSRVEKALAILIDQVFRTPEVGMFFATAATESGERLDMLVDHLVRPYHDVLMPMLFDAIDSGDFKKQDPEVMFAMLLHSIGKTVAYSHVLLPFTTLPASPEAFKQAVLVTALAMLG